MLARLEKIAAVAAGYPCKIEENTGKNQFTLRISATPDIVDEEAVLAALQPVKPARLQVKIIYEQAIKHTQYISGIMRPVRTVINLQQIN